MLREYLTEVQDLTEKENTQGKELCLKATQWKISLEMSTVEIENPTE